MTRSKNLFVLAGLVLAMAMLTTACLLADPPPAPAPADGQAEVPVSRVILFSSGVGYFEHAGAVDGNASARLMFKTEQINDVLKSMIVNDLDGGTVQRIGYGSKEPLERALKSFGVDLSGDPSLYTLLHQLRGAEIIVSGSEKVTGKVYDVEFRTKVHEPGSIQEREDLLDLFVPGVGLKQIPLAGIQSFKLTDEKLDGELNKALGLMVASRDKDRKPVDILFAGKGKRNVRIGYIIETPVWKTSYRLSLSGEKPQLQGWAIVDNITDSDWAGVKLTLMSGRPMSFVQDLYTPLYVPRPVVVPELYGSLVPKVYDEGVVADDKVAKLAAEPPAPAAVMAGGPMGAPSRPSADYRARDQANKRDGKVREQAESLSYAALKEVNDSAISLNGGTVQSLAAAGKVGELFKYDITEPVTLARRGSAMLPVINGEIKAEKVSIYNQQVLAKNPLNGAYLTNDTKLTLMAGPITVLDDNAYAGDARMDNMAPDEKRLISYAVDLNVTVDPSVNTSSAIAAVKIVRGVLNVTRKHTFTQEYTIHNKVTAAKAMIIEQPFVGDGRKLIEPKDVEEKTAAIYRFRVPVKAETTGKFKVVEERSDLEQMAILTTGTDYFAGFQSSNEIPKNVKDALLKAAGLKNDLAQLQAKMATLQQQQANLKGDQARLRENVKTFGAQSPEGKQFAQKLMDSEAQIDKLDGQIKELLGQAQAKQKELEDYLNTLNVE